MKHETKNGAHVERKTVQGKTRGAVSLMVSSMGGVGGHVAKATMTEPRFLVRGTKTCANATRTEGAPQHHGWEHHA